MKHAAQRAADPVQPVIETTRLRLRPLHGGDLDSLAAIHADPVAMEFLAQVLSREATANMIAKAEAHWRTHGFGLFAVEVKGGPSCIGIVGLNHVADNMPMAPAVEIAWRLSRDFWGQGYAGEAAQAVLRYAFDKLNLDEIIAFTVPANVRSRSVMSALRFRRVLGGDFQHPNLSEGHALRHHVLYRHSRSDFENKGD